MKNKHSLLLGIILLFCAFSFNTFCQSTIDIDFTRDSVRWMKQFPQSVKVLSDGSLSASVSNLTIDDYRFNGTWGKFNADSLYRAQPLKIETPVGNRTWAFRFDQTEK